MTGRRFPLTKVSASESLVDVPAWKIEMKNKNWKVLSKQTKKMCFISESDPQLRGRFRSWNLERQIQNIIPHEAQLFADKALEHTWI